MGPYWRTAHRGGRLKCGLGFLLNHGSKRNIDYGEQVGCAPRLGCIGAQNS